MSRMSHKVIRIILFKDHHGTFYDVQGNGSTEHSMVYREMGARNILWCTGKWEHGTFYDVQGSGRLE